ncbi:SagB/ThcOx family dehydrogenase [Pseudomonas aeruginosa]|nr:SagB/ThcOx family dehydrogenase [Pseudomonas aeruginosa]
MGDGGGEVLSYHRLSMHRPERYAPGPGGLDWATQPAPFRQYRGCRQIELLHRPLEESPPYDGVFSGPAAAPSRLDRRSLSQMLYDGLALSAWKQAGGTRWALRVNPSSGNLHPTEAYLLLPCGTLEPAPLLAHYRPDKHALEVRGELPATLASLLDDCLPPGGCLLALTSVHWREAWKYGERAYRYCQHDLGHALACLSIAAAIQGWEMRLLRGVAESALDGLFGLDRDGFAECESVDALFWIGPALTQEPSLSPRLCEGLAALPLAGAPNRLSREYRDWPELQRIHGLCRAPRLPARPWRVAPGEPGNDNPGLPLRPLLHRRRSAQRRDGRAGSEGGLLRAGRRRRRPERSPVPCAVTGEAARVDLLLFVHRVRGLVPGLYWLDRSGLRRPPMREDFLWQHVDPELPLYLLQEGDARALSAYLSCQQDIAGDGCVALAMLAHLGAALEEGPWCYPRLYWECGQLGQLLYLEAEAAGLSGTGIGCYYDPLVHELLGLTDESMASLYHFTLGRAVWDTRLCNMPAYPALRRD